MNRRFYSLNLALAGLVWTATTACVCAQDAPPTTPAPTTGQPPAPPAPIDPEKEKSIRELLTLQQTAKTIQDNGRRMIAQFRQSRPDIPADFWNRFTAKLEKVDEIINEAVRHYAQRYSTEEIDGLIVFYKSPLGQKFATETSGIQKDLDAFGEKWSQRMGQETAKEMADARKAGEKPFDKSPFKGNGKVVTTKSGLQYEEMTVGTGAEAVAGKTAVVHYTGTLTDGKKFDSSRDRGESFEFPLGAGRVIKGWDEGVAGMKVGGRRKLIIPAKLGYGAQGTPGGPIPPNATLVFDVELMDVR